ncbi:multidrug resistance protein 7 [Metschnikowia bicuspidata var. bicuspidata NRRL YB-4993]|uniref:Multidrug resistance protein 7 n=1 Tax=Metschnikowia bicuspidata var. bicuspidata NRRL YB-4993 TaxID=869754 RepID=A0A1A0H6R8_9ASCO|nr:multidrug resistance protein 7 [Metschnikowia bicuspidata var. bicuspidata NRRL YB-4993]OBA19603.1 multidrug resistance protein 7 [Metschnikowia bicuspidata var. bicuspidata NRRL YB-4993]
MFRQILRDSFWGQIIYHLSKRKVLAYKEDSPTYVIPEIYDELARAKERSISVSNSVDPERQTLSNSGTNAESSSESTNTITSNKIIVTWDGEDDPENPYNWPVLYKVLFILKIGLLTAFVYMASAIYTPGLDQIMESMQVGRVLATLPLTLFVFGYGIGPMVLSPLSENARFGRTSIYVVTLFIFFILQIPTALVTDIASLSVLRFLAGFFASPCLATGGASLGDITAIPYMPMALSGWSAGAVAAPTLGPVIGAALVVAGGYHWPFWFVCISSGALFLVLSFFLPESYGKTILYRKAERLRALTGNMNITSEGHIENEAKEWGKVLVETFWRPFEIMIFEPVVLLINIYLGLLYAIIYLWFEAFPIVFFEMYGFTLVEMGASYICLIVGIFVGFCFYLPVIYKIFTKRILRGDQVTPEVLLPLCIVGSVMSPTGLIILAWTATPSVHWIVPMIGGGLFMCGAFIIYQTMFNYIGMSFYRFLASVFAGNAFFRAMMGGAFPLFGRAMFTNLSTSRFPVAWGTMILAIIMWIMVLIPVLFYLNGPKLRARSKYAN